MSSTPIRPNNSGHPPRKIAIANKTSAKINTNDKKVIRHLCQISNHYIDMIESAKWGHYLSHAVVEKYESDIDGGVDPVSVEQLIEALSTKLALSPLDKSKIAELHKVISESGLGFGDIYQTNLVLYRK